MEIVRLGPGFAAEVKGVGLADVAESDEAYRAVRAAFEAESVLVFRGQDVTDEGQVAFSRRFGPLETVKVASLGEGGYFSILTNVVDGRVVPPTHRQALVAKANQLWHTDSSFKRTPALASILSARTIPGHGGETEFASTRLAWERLPEATRARLQNEFAWHDYAHSRGQIDPELATPAERASLPPVCWRMAWTNPANGRTALYVASHAFAIEGMGRAEAQALLGQLIDEATRPELTYLHRWQPGDVVMWDNRATMHRGRPWPDDLPRHMMRTTVSATDADGVASVRPPQREAAPAA
jgi:alpha-ketoglutarate-dependent 2,4-dichlorophenoxyacetate dioxygenase